MQTINDFTVGEKVYFGRTQGEKTLGTVIRKGTAKLKVRQDEARGTMKSYPVGTVWTVPPTLCTKTSATTTPATTPATTAPAPAKRSDAAIMQDIKGVYNALSPENLSCDGELPMSRVRARASQLRNQLRILFREIGRTVTEDEAYGINTTGLRDMISKDQPPTTPRYKKGEKVSFTDKQGVTVTGFVRQVNLKTVTVDPIGATNGRYWRVPPHMLKRA